MREGEFRAMVRRIRSAALVQAAFPARSAPAAASEARAAAAHSSPHFQPAPMPTPAAAFRYRTSCERRSMQARACATLFCSVGFAHLDGAHYFPPDASPAPVRSCYGLRVHRRLRSVCAVSGAAHLLSMSGLSPDQARTTHLPFRLLLVPAFCLYVPLFSAPHCSSLSVHSYRLFAPIITPGGTGRHRPLRRGHRHDPRAGYPRPRVDGARRHPAEGGARVREGDGPRRGEMGAWTA